MRLNPFKRNNPEKIAINTPTISFDRALGHFIDYLNTDNLVTAIQAFYSQLKPSRKEPLDNLHIHFSATDPYGEESGLFTNEGTVNSPLCKDDPSLPETNCPTIIIYVGTNIRLSARAINDPTDISGKINTTLAHELVHYAQMCSIKPDENTDTPYEQQPREIKAFKLQRDIGAISLSPHIGEMPGGLSVKDLKVYPISIYGDFTHDAGVQLLKQRRLALSLTPPVRSPHSQE